jgi:hypothetical protein
LTFVLERLCRFNVEFEGEEGDHVVWSLAVGKTGRLTILG